LEAEEKAGDPIYFRFEVHENQRWWMGLDWTGALLPQERPSWCDSHLLPASPPASFPLPSAASIILPAPTKADPDSKVKRVATWKWLDEDWQVVRSGASATQSGMAIPTSPPEVETIPAHASSRSISEKMGVSPSSTTTLDDAMSAGARAHSIAEQAFTKGLERLKARTTSPAGMTGLGILGGSPGKTSGEMRRGRTGSQASEDLKDIHDVGGSGGVQASHAPGETIPEKDDVSAVYGLRSLLMSVRQPIRMGGCTETINGRIQVLAVVSAEWVSIG
jgi:hypothetical protein